MPKITKRLVRPGTYRDMHGVVGTFTSDHIKAYQDIHKKLRANGFYVPIPDEHDESKPTKTKPNRHVDKMWLGEDEWLYAEFDVQKSDREAFDKKDVSIRTYDDAAAIDNIASGYIGHVALVDEPACKFQGPSLSNEPQMCLSLSSRVCLAHENQTTVDTSKENLDASIDSCLQILQDLGLTLPSDTTEMNICERIAIAGQAVIDSKKLQEDDEFTDEPSGTEVKKPSPIAMSQTVLNLALSKLKNGHVKDPHGNEYTEESLNAEFSSTQPQSPSPASLSIPEPTPGSLSPPATVPVQAQIVTPTPAATPQSTALSQALEVTGIKSRIEACAAQGKIGPDLVVSHGQPLLSALVVALESGDQQGMETAKLSINAVLPAWEALPQNTALALSNGGMALSSGMVIEQPQGPEHTPEMTPELARQIAKEQTGR